MSRLVLLATFIGFCLFGPLVRMFEARARRVVMLPVLMFPVFYHGLVFAASRVLFSFILFSTISERFLTPRIETVMSWVFSGLTGKPDGCCCFCCRSAAPPPAECMNE